MKRRPSKSELLKIWGILAYQFDGVIATHLLSPAGSIEIELSTKGRIRYVIKNGKRILTLRPSTGTFSISLTAAKTILTYSSPPKYRVIVKGDREIKGSVLARDVIEADPYINPYDEVVIVNSDDRLLGVGRAKVSGSMMKLINFGEVVRVRKTLKNSLI